MVVTFSFIILVHLVLGTSLAPSPMLGDLTDTSLKICVPSARSKNVIVTLLGTEQSFMAETSTVQLNSLEPNTTYKYSINGEH